MKQVLSRIPPESQAILRELCHERPSPSPQPAHLPRRWPPLTTPCSLQHQQQVAQAVERAKQVTMTELNAIIGVRGLPSLPLTVCIALLFLSFAIIRTNLTLAGLKEGRPLGSDPFGGSFLWAFPVPELKGCQTLPRPALKHICFVLPGLWRG